MKKAVLIFLGVTFTSAIVTACYKYKRCCKRDYMGNLQCQTICNLYNCPLGYNIVIR